MEIKNVREERSMAKNMVIAGNYAGKLVRVSVGPMGVPSISLNIFKDEYVLIDKYSVESFNVVNKEEETSAVSGIARSAIGGALFGAPGFFGGAASAKNKTTYTVAINFKDGKRSLVEVDEEIYEAILRACF